MILCKRWPARNTLEPRVLEQSKTGLNCSVNKQLDLIGHNAKQRKCHRNEGVEWTGITEAEGNQEELECVLSRRGL